MQDGSVSWVFWYFQSQIMGHDCCVSLLEAALLPTSVSLQIWAENQSNMPSVPRLFKQMLGTMFLLRIPNQWNFKLTNWKNRWILDEAVIPRLKLISVGSFNPICQEGRVGTLGEYSVPERKERFLFWPLNKGRMNPGRNDLAEV